jgi:hypothetical protein
MPIRGTLDLVDCWALKPWGEDYAVLAIWNGMLAWFEVRRETLAVVLFP